MCIAGRYHDVFDGNTFSLDGVFKEAGRGAAAEGYETEVDQAVDGI